MISITKNATTARMTKSEDYPFMWSSGRIRAVLPLNCLIIQKYEQKNTELRCHTSAICEKSGQNDKLPFHPPKNR